MDQTEFRYSEEEIASMTKEEKEHALSQEWLSSSDFKNPARMRYLQLLGQRSSGTQKCKSGRQRKTVTAHDTRTNSGKGRTCVPQQQNPAKAREKQSPVSC